MRVPTSSTRRAGRDVGVSLLMGLLLLVAGGFTMARAEKPIGRMELHPLPTMTLTPAQFLTDEKQGTPATIAGELHLPFGVQGRLPAVVLVHGAGGVTDTCATKGVTAGGNPGAQAAAVKAVTEFLTTTFKLSP